MKTPITDIIEHLDREVALKFLTKKDGDRLKWYIQTYFIKKEKEFAKKCFMAGADYGIDSVNAIEWGEEYGVQPDFNMWYKQFEDD